MDRFGVFVDAGYLFAAAGELCCGTRDRRKLTLDHVQGGIAQTLEMEADVVLKLDKKFLAKRISLAVSPAVTAPVPAPPKAPPAPVDVGREFGIWWLAQVAPDEAQAVKVARPRIPMELDRALLVSATAHLSKAHLEDAERAEIRAGFWDALTVPDPQPSATP